MSWHISCYSWVTIIMLIPAGDILTIIVTLMHLNCAIPKALFNFRIDPNNIIALQISHTYV